MKIDNEMTDEAVLIELGARMCRIRLDKNLTQSQVATEAGVGLKTLQRLEQGQVGSQLSSLVRICRVLGIIDRLNLMLPEPMPSPIAQLKQLGKQRRRASRVNQTGKVASRTNRVSEAKPKWTWGE